jgi:hypothetical protein
MVGYSPAFRPDRACEATLEDLAQRAGWRLAGTYARGACPLCGSRTGAWGTIDHDREVRVGCWGCSDWRGLRFHLGLEGAGAWAGRLWQPPPVPKGKTHALDMEDDAEWLDAIYSVFARHLAMPSDRRHIVLGRDRGIGTELQANVAPLLAGLPRDPPERERVRRTIAQDLRQAAPPEVLRRVPELAARRGGGFAVLLRREEAQYFEPWRDEFGRTVALRAYMGRRAEPRYLTSAGRTGPLVHFAFGVAREHVASVPWLLTEGWMKAEVAAHALGVVAVALPGVATKASWRRALAAKQRLAPDAPTVIAFDAEAWTTRLDIACHALELALEVQRRTGRQAGFAVWDAEADQDGKPQPKGIDDAVVAGATVRLVERAGFARYLAHPLHAWEERHGKQVA